MDSRMPRTKSALVKTAAQREIISQYFISGAERAKDGHILAWSRSVREVVNEYLKRIADDPGCTIILTLESEPGSTESAT